MLAAAGFVAAFGLLFALVGGSGILRDRKLRGGGIKAAGVIVAQQDRVGTGEGDLTQHPVVAFETGDGRSMRVESRVGTNQSSFVPGRRVTVYYDPADPRRCSIAGRGTGVYRLFLAIGLGIMLFALVWVIASNSEELLNTLPLGIPLLLGGIFAGVGWYGIRRTLRIKRGGPVDGVVVGASTSSTRNGITLHHPVVRYPGPSGHPIDAPSIRGRMGAPPPPGTWVRVNYDPADPNRMLLATDGTAPTFWLFGIVGVVVFVIGLVIFVAVVVL